MQRTRRRLPRTEVACAECRARKLKCEGSRPTCSRCQTLHRECSYFRPPEQSLRKARYERTQKDLLQRVKKLEDELRLVSETNSCSDHGFSNDEQITPQTPPSVRRINRNSDYPTQSEQLGEAIDDDETTVDLVATDAFDESSQRQIGYFGPWSNHAIFQFISACFWRASAHHTSIDLDGSLKDSLSESHSNMKPPDSLELSRKRPLPRIPNERCSLPSKPEGARLLHRFFESAGVMLAYLNREDIVKRYESARHSNPPRFSRVLLILLNIVWAHASSSFGDARSEIFYHRAMGLLNLHTLQGSSYDLVQSLLLLALYQQNHQRSILSYTTHAMCVKTAYQLGLHVLDNASHTEEYRSRQQLWAAVVNNDRVFSSTLGRPPMISEALLTFAWDQNLDSSTTPSSYFLIHLRRLNSILAEATELFSRGNHTKLDHLAISELICKRHRLFHELEQWRDHLTPFSGLISQVSLTDGISTSETSTAIRVTLSISYYRVCMAINFPLIASLLDALLHDETKDWQLQHLRQNSHQAIQHDWTAIANLHQIMKTIHASRDEFVNMYAAHYMCNYTIFTATLHLFAILLIHKRDSISDMSMQRIRQMLDAYLSTMEVFEQTSLMTWKARRCVYRQLLVFDNFGDEITHTPNMSVDQQQYHHQDQQQQTGHMSIQEYAEQAIGDLLQQYSHDELFDLDVSFMELYSSIPLCE